MKIPNETTATRAGLGGLRQKDKWDQQWGVKKSPPTLDTRSSFGLDFDKVVRAWFKGIKCSNLKLLEVGCAGGGFMVYFNKNFGFNVSGVDYAPSGCRLAEVNLRLANVDGEVVCEDFFKLKCPDKSRFDVVFSSGFVEHFEDLGSVVKKHVGFLKPGGTLMIVVPNLEGLHGLLLKTFNMPAYNEHKVVTQRELKACFLRSGISVEKSCYLGSMVLESAGEPRWILPFFAVANKVVYILQRITGLSIQSARISPYILVIGKSEE